MNEQLQSALVSIIEKATTGIDAGVSFLSSEMPDVISQLIMWKMSYYSFYFVLGVILIITSILISKSMIKGRKNKDESIWWDGRYGMSEGGIFAAIVCAVAFSLGLIMAILNLTRIMQISIAPKIWLLEYAASLVK